MQSEPKSRTGGQILADQLLAHDVRMAFCVPGESYLELLDALHDREQVELINARHEAGAANMAEAYGKLTGKPGICLVTRGPGACHAAVGVHTAFQDSTPMILLVGQVARWMTDREAFQEIDYRQMFGPIAKWAAQIDSAARIPEYMARAFNVATSGRPGPVVLALPEDMLSEAASVANAAPVPRFAPSPTAKDLLPLRDLLEASQRPLFVVGGSGWTDSASKSFMMFAEANGIPVACSFRRQDVFDNRSENFVGELGTSVAPTLVSHMKSADLIVAVGARLGEMTTQGYSLLETPLPHQALVHIHPEPSELGRVFAPRLGMNTTVEAFAVAISNERWTKPNRFAAWREKARADYMAGIVPPPYSGSLDLGQVMSQLQKRLPEDFVLTLDAGNHTGWPQRFLQFARPARQIGPTSGAMGYSVPAGVAASLLYRDRLVVSCVGDGGFMMSGQELATAVQHGGKLIVLLFNNGLYGTIRMHQEREYPGRVVGTTLVNPDFVALARSMGAHAERVTTTDDFGPALERSVASGQAAVIELVTDPNQITTRATLAGIREKSLAQRNLQSA